MMNELLNSKLFSRRPHHSIPSESEKILLPHKDHYNDFQITIYLLNLKSTPTYLTLLVVTGFLCSPPMMIFQMKFFMHENHMFSSKNDSASSLQPTIVWHSLIHFICHSHAQNFRFEFIIFLSQMAFLSTHAMMMSIHIFCVF